VGEKDGVRRAEEFDEVGHDLCGSGLSSHHRIRDAVHLLDVRGNGYVRIDELLEGGELATIQSKADGSYRNFARKSGVSQL
jgi:hypothetical protein